MTTNYSDLSKMKIAQAKYPEKGSYPVGQLIEIEGTGKNIGYDSDIVDDSTGLQAYSMTDKQATADPASVQHVTLLYRGSSFDLSSPDSVMDTYQDWVKNDMPIGLSILDAISEGSPYVETESNKTEEKIAPQILSASDYLLTFVRFNEWTICSL